MTSQGLAINAAPRGRSRDLADLHHLASRLMLYLLVVTTVSVVGFPIFWMVICSFKSGGELYQLPPRILPQQWTFENYVQLFTQTNFFDYFVNSLIVALSATALSLVVGGLGAYSLSRFRFRGMRTFSTLTFVCYMLPEVLLVIPLYIYAVDTGLADTLLSLIIANTAFTLPLTLWYMRSYFNAIPASLEESAMIDGCTRFQAMRKVTLPLALPGLVSVGVFSFNNAWNEFLLALVFMSTESKKVLSVGLATWIGQDNLYNWGMLLGGGVLVTLPVVIFYLIVQRNVISGLSEGGVKGE